MECRVCRTGCIEPCRGRAGRNMRRSRNTNPLRACSSHTCSPCCSNFPPKSKLPNLRSVLPNLQSVLPNLRSVLPNLRSVLCWSNFYQVKIQIEIILDFWSFGEDFWRGLEAPWRLLGCFLASFFRVCIGDGLWVTITVPPRPPPQWRRLQKLKNK